MNTVRWVLAHEMQLDRNRQQMRQWARLFGTDIDALGDTEKPAGFGEPARVFPLAGLINPEAYNNFLQQDHGGENIEETPMEQYEQQVAELEQRGGLTDIDLLGLETEKKIRDKNDEKYGVIIEKDK